MAKKKATSEPLPVPEETTAQAPVLPAKLLNAEQVMELFGVGRTQISLWVKAGMPHYRLGKQRVLRFEEGKLAVWLTEREVNVT